MTTGLSGIHRASLVLAARLERAGHRVTYACPQDVRASVEDHGLRWHKLDPVAFSPAPQLAAPGLSGKLGHKLRELRSARQRRMAGVQALGMDRFRSDLEELRPDLILIDQELVEHVITASAAGYPLALLDPFFAHREQPGLPPIDSTVRPGRGWLGGPLGLRCLHLRKRLGVRSGRLRVWLRYFGTDRRCVLLAYARGIGFPAGRLRHTDGLLDVTFEGIPTLRLVASELDFPHPPEELVHDVGAMLSATADAQDRADAPAPDLKQGASGTGEPETGPPGTGDPGEAGGAVKDVALESALAGSSGPERRLLYASSTSMDTTRNASFLATLVGLARVRPDWTVIVSLGGAASPPPDSLPPNALVRSWIDVHAVLSKASAALVHGGIHTLHECVAQRVPMLVRSGERFDQNGNAARIAYHRLGRILPPELDNPHELAGALDQLTADQAIAGSLARAAETLQRYREEALLESVIENLVQG